MATCLLYKEIDIMSNQSKLQNLRRQVYFFYGLNISYSTASSSAELLARKKRPLGWPSFSYSTVRRAR